MHARRQVAPRIGVLKFGVWGFLLTHNDEYIIISVFCVCFEGGGVGLVSLSVEQAVLVCNSDFGMVRPQKCHSC